MFATKNDLPESTHSYSVLWGQHEYICLIVWFVMIGSICIVQV